MTRVSIIVPVKNSQDTIGETVDALLRQTHPGALEILLVGDPQDATWDAIRPAIDSGSVRIIETRLDTRGRDANHKRNVGLRAATGDVLCLTDSDMAPPPHWIATGLALLSDGWPCVAGPMASATPGFWGGYVDGNPIASKTPRMAGDYVANRETLGVRGQKPPITANVMFAREVYERVGGLDPRFVHSYEDYEWFQRIADAGFDILCTPRLTARHQHRQGWGDLVREYHRSGRGCAQFVRKHRSSRFGRNRLQQLAAVVVLATLAVLDLLTVATGAWKPAVVFFAAGCTAAVLLSVATAVRTRRPEAAAYPIVTLILGMAFSAGMLAGLVPLAPARRSS